MSKLNIEFNGASFGIDESILESASADLKAYLSSVMNGTGATINFGGVDYGVDSTKLSAATNSFIAHLGAIAGTGAKITIGGVEYSVDSTKIQGAVSEFETILGNLSNLGGDGVMLLSSDNFMLNDSNGLFLLAKEGN